MAHGTVFDLVIIAIVFFILVVVGSVALLIGTSFQTAIEGQGLNSSYMNQTNAGLGFYFDLLPFMLICMGIASLILAYNIPASPILAPISLIILAIFVIASAMLSNVLYAFATVPQMVAIFNAHALVVWAITYLPYIIGIIGLALILVQYSRIGNSGL